MQLLRPMQDRQRLCISKFYKHRKVCSHLTRSAFLNGFNTFCFILATDDVLRDQEAALIKLGQLYRDEKYVDVNRHDLLCDVDCIVFTCCRNAKSLAEVVKSSRGFMSNAAKAKTAKLSLCLHTWLRLRDSNIHLAVRTLIDYFSDIPGSEKVQIEVTQDNIEWARNEKRIFLKQSLEARLIALCVLVLLHRLCTILVPELDS